MSATVRIVEPVHLMVNPVAGQGRAAAQRDHVANRIAAAGHPVVMLDCASPESAAVELRERVSDQAERVMVVGGDGMVHLAVQALAESNTVLGIVPAGTGNDFAAAIGLPTDIDAAVDVALGAGLATDLLRISNDETDAWATSIATYGFAADVNERANAMRWPKGSSRYTLATVRQLPRLAATEVHAEIDGEATVLESVLTTFANTSDFGGGMQICPAADPTDGLLDLTIVGPIGRLSLLRFFRKVFDGSHVDHRAVTTRRAAAVALLTPGIKLRADGEAVTTSPCRIEVVASALRLARPGNVSRDSGFRTESVTP